MQVTEKWTRIRKFLATQIKTYHWSARKLAWLLKVDLIPAVHIPLRHNVATDCRTLRHSLAL
jgi:hypothetical protein